MGGRAELSPEPERCCPDQHQRVRIYRGEEPLPECGTDHRLFSDYMGQTFAEIKVASRSETLASQIRQMKMRMRIENILPVLASVLAIGTLLAHEPGGVRGALHWQRSSGQSGDTINHHLTGRCQAVDTLVRVPIQTGAGGLTLIGVSEGSTEQPLLSIRDGSRART